MKKMVSIENGVSAVIGTILMIAITVVLAATLLLYVYMTPSATYEPTIIGKFASIERVNDSTYKLVFSNFNFDVKISSLKGVLYINETRYNFIFPSPFDSTSAIITPKDSNTQNLQIIYRDLSNNSFINRGDYLLLRNLKPDTMYKIYFLDAHGSTLLSGKFQT
ncbi:archaeal flagellin-like protein [Aciduliprofundum sp. MAR08-339]|uniref:type IV pilin n=1 Tax=Aciduliprofundum sp. (strain MAR08-339) TaxID=673860 RepID=UPI0002A47AEC|nr:archaeal flagellin-like protein [Aciduliprofundum sp. MAR08-339]